MHQGERYTCMYERAFGLAVLWHAPRLYCHAMNLFLLTAQLHMLQSYE